MRIVTFASGSTGNCTLISDGNTHILVDAGISMRRITNCLSRLSLTMQDIAGVLITHEHRDHVAALATMIKRSKINFFAPRTVANHLRFSLAGIDDRMNIIIPGKTFSVKDMTVTAFNTSHDTDESVGYRISGSALIGYCTDTGCVTDAMVAALSGVSAAVIEANHDEDMLRYGSYPYFLKRRVLSEHGHLSNAACGVFAAFLCQSGAEKFILAHLSRENNRPELALNTVCKYLKENGFSPEVSVAPMDGFCIVEVEGGLPDCSELSSSAAESCVRGIT
ncbi:MAG: MBL fold metallo-hydrolase [Oscillospiraceae bacterium]